MDPTYELRRGVLPTRKRWRFVLLAENAEVVAISEHYNSREKAPSAEVVDLTRS